MKCEAIIRGKYSRSRVDRKCGKNANYVDEHQRALCSKHFKKWYKKKYGEEYEKSSD